MSEELADEIEAINSIYGAETLRRADDDNEAANGDKAYILQLPGEASWLRLRFPTMYPSSAPVAVGTERSPGGVRAGTGARDLALFREVLGDVFKSGAVCVFDAVEEFATRRAACGEDDDDDDDDDDDEEGEGEPVPSAADTAAAAVGDDGDFPPPAWTVSEAVTENKSTFVAHVTRVTTAAQARAYIAHLKASDRRVRAATHNMTAWRVRGGRDDDGGGMHDCDDDGESAAGARLLRLMHLVGLWDALVVVSRWYGGVKLGPRRFALINAVARDGFVRAGLVVEHDKARGKRAR